MKTAVTDRYKFKITKLIKGNWKTIWFRGSGVTQANRRIEQQARKNKRLGKIIKTIEKNLSLSKVGPFVF